MNAYFDLENPNFYWEKTLGNVLGDEFKEPSISVESFSKTGILIIAFSDEFEIPDRP